MALRVPHPLREGVRRVCAADERHYTHLARPGGLRALVVQAQGAAGEGRAPPIRGVRRAERASGDRAAGHAPLPPAAGGVAARLRAPARPPRAARRRAVAPHPRGGQQRRARGRGDGADAREPARRVARDSAFNSTVSPLPHADSSPQPTGLGGRAPPAARQRARRRCFRCRRRRSRPPSTLHPPLPTAAAPTATRRPRLPRRPASGRSRATRSEARLGRAFLLLHSFPAACLV